MDYVYMRRAIELSKKGIGFVNPNPLVGAVIVKNGHIIGEGYHKRFGGPHAEIEALMSTKEDVAGATMYVTLEPCSHYGKTPPCAEAIIRKKISRVVVAMTDPNPLVSGRGIQILKDHGIEVVTGLLASEVERVNEIFIKYITTQLPFCILKTAMTLDGKIATSTGESMWITGDASRKSVHEIRHQVSGIMVGIGTVLADNPSLTTRLPSGHGANPNRIIVDTKGVISLDSKVLEPDDTSKTIIATTEKADFQKLQQLREKGATIIITPLKDHKVDLTFLMTELGKIGIDSILLEGGSELNFSAIEEHMVDKVITYIAPKILGGKTAKTPVGGNGIENLTGALLLEDMSMEFLDCDIKIEAYVRR